MSAKELREKTTEALGKELLDLLKEKASLSMQKRAGEGAPKPHQHEVVRREIARIKTILTERKDKA